jgi:isocitrate dehydrogenase
VRPTIAYAPYVATKFPHMNLVIIRENEEGTYSGIEHRQTDEVYQCLKLVTRPGCERIVHYAFEYARKFNRKKVTCLTKDNIMKMTDGIFHQVFNEIATEYPDIQNEHLIIDIGTALVATDPDRFDVIVTSNLYGDILSDVAAQIGGSVGLAGSANVGNHMAMFEAIHGSAPDIAGKKIANPSGLINAAIQMLIHINQPDAATKIQNAWLTTLEEGIHTADIYTKEYSKKKVNTDEFAAAVVANLGKQPKHFPVADFKETKTKIECYGEVKKPLAKKELVGIDVFIDNPDMTPEQIGEKLRSIHSPMQVITITSRGLKIWPDSMIKAPYAQHCSCRFQSSTDVRNLKPVTHRDLVQLLEAFDNLNLDVIKTENLYTFDGQVGFSLAQGQ